MPKSRAAPTAPDLAWPVANRTGICFGFRRAVKAGRMSPVAVRKTRRPGARRAAARRDTVKPAPGSAWFRSAARRRWSISERIITRLRAEGYQLSRRLRRRRRGGGQYLRLSQLGQAGEPGRHRRSDGQERARCRHWLLWRGKGAHSCRPPRRAGRYGPASIRTSRGGRARSGAATARSLPRSRAAGRLAPDAPPLRVSEDFRGLQQPLFVLHYPQPARAARQPPRCPGDEARPNAW